VRTLECQSNYVVDPGIMWKGEDVIEGIWVGTFTINQVFSVILMKEEV
jgi:hypothetical protein